MNIEEDNKLAAYNLYDPIARYFYTVDPFPLRYRQTFVPFL